MTRLQGSCLCGRIQYTVQDQFENFHFCHCTQCQKATGAPHAANLFIKPEKFTWTAGESFLKRYDVPERAISQAFCTECGSGLPYLSLSGSGLMVIPAGTLDDTPTRQPQRHIFWNERAAWYEGILACEKHATFPSED